MVCRGFYGLAFGAVGFDKDEIKKVLRAQPVDKRRLNALHLADPACIFKAAPQAHNRAGIDIC